MSQTIYVAGHNGMVGSAIIRQLQNDTNSIILTATRDELDLTNQQGVEQFFVDNKIDQVYLAAAKVGGIVANNPSLVGLIDAMQLTDNKVENISLVSIGTGEQCHMPYDVEKLKKSGKLSWMLHSKGSPILELLMDSQSKLAHFQTQFLLNDRYVRLNPKLSITIELDSANKVNSLKNLADISKGDLDRIQILLL